MERQMLRRTGAVIASLGLCLLTGGLTALMLTSSLSQTSPTAGLAKADLAPTGKLRLAFPVDSGVYAVRVAPANEFRGVVIDLGTEIARRLAVDFEPIPYSGGAELMNVTGADKWDLAAVAFDRERTKTLDFSRIFLESDATFLVAAGSSIYSIADADYPGVRISVAEKSAYDLALTRMFKYATLIRRPNVPAAFEVLTAGDADAVAGPRQAMLDFQTKVSGSRVLD
jgi:polar amino acid transport system substrate-binding protein